MSNLRAARGNWSKNHRHQGGLPALLRCWRGQRRLERAPRIGPDRGEEGFEVLTFSVVPWLTALWGRCLRGVLPSPLRRLVVADASGGLRGPWRRLLGGPEAEVHPCLNHHHGEKLDLFFAKVCRSRRVLVCDDDVFWLDDRALVWAAERFAEDPRLAVVSLAPRERVSELLAGRMIEPMGSSCLLVRWPLWRREGLSFAMAPADDGEPADWFYDTGDRAHLELLHRGYRVLVAPPEIRAGLVPLEAISGWILKAQKHPPEHLARIADLPVRRTKALAALLTASRLLELARRLGTALQSASGLQLAQTADRLRRAAAAVAARVEPAEHRVIEGEVARALVRIEDALGIPASAAAESG